MAKNTISGPKMRSYLRSIGIDVQQVTQQRSSGCYVADFYQDKMQTPVESSKAWAQIIEDRLQDSTIVDNHDTVADWRPGKPVIWASVTFRLDDKLQ